MTKLAHPTLSAPAAEAQGPPGSTAWQGFAGPLGDDCDGGVVENLSSILVTIGDASFVVPRDFYENKEWLDILPWDEALGGIWPLQKAQMNSLGLTDEEIDGLWACIDLENDDGEFFKGSLPSEIGSGGKLGGYAGWFFYWVTQSVAMYWEHTRDGVTVPANATEPTHCFGIDSSADRLFRFGTRGERWHVNGRKSWGSGGTWGGSTYTCHPDFSCGEYYEDCKDGAHTASCQGNLTKPESASEKCLCNDPDDGVYVTNKATTHTNASNDYDLVVVDPSPTANACGELSMSVTSLSTALKAGVTDEDAGGDHAHSGNSPCAVHFKAEWIGKSALVVDYLLMWAHVATALYVRAPVATGAEAYRSAALLLGKYAYRELLDYAEIPVHELGHNYLGSGGHLPHSCCMCTTSRAWYSGVCALLGLPDSTTSTRQGFSRAGEADWTTYDSWILEVDDQCSNDHSDEDFMHDGVMVRSYTANYFNHLTVYADPGVVGGERMFYASVCDEFDSEGHHDSYIVPVG